MKHALKILAVSAVALLMAVPVAFAQSPEVSTLPITEPTDVGGTILQPGDYLIRVVSPQADRNKVQITSLDRQTIYATVLTIPHQLEPNEEIPNTTYVFFPAGEGQPRALRTWFSTNPVTGGHDFVYEESRARQLARLVNEPVSVIRGEEVAVITPEPLPPPAPATVETTVVTTPAPAPVPEPAPMVSAAPAEDTTEAPVEMPQTASRIPMLLLLGLLAFAAAVVVRIARA